MAPHAYAPRKKRSRIFKAICDSLGVSDLSAGSDFQHLFAQFADELSTRNDHEHDFKTFNVGTYGLCISCAGELYSSETWEVFNRHGERIQVCEHCLNEYYRLCEHCNEYYPKDSLTIVGDGSRVCSQCIDEDYAVCDECDEYFLRGELSEVVNADGDTILICQACREQKAVSA